MDTTQTTHISLCAGYGGIDLGLKRAIPNLRTIAVSEIEGFACANLVSKMEAGALDAAPIWTDLKTFPWGEFHAKVDLLSGGYPCQPFSTAGKRLGTEDPRHLWPFIADGIRLMQPRVCFFENVEGHISLGLREVIGELESMGYSVAWGIFSAAEVGAPHQRKRVFILAHGSGQRRQLSDWWQQSGIELPFSNVKARGNVWPTRPSQPQHQWEPFRVVGDSEVRQNNGRKPRNLGQEEQIGACGNDAVDPSSEVLGDSEVGQIKFPLGGTFNGTSSGMDYAELCVSCDNRTDELRLLGNGVVPATAEKAFRTLMQQLTNTTNKNK